MQTSGNVFVQLFFFDFVFVYLNNDESSSKFQKKKSQKKKYTKNEKLSCKYRKKRKGKIQGILLFLVQITNHFRPFAFCISSSNSLHLLIEWRFEVVFIESLSLSLSFTLFAFGFKFYFVALVISIYIHKWVYGVCNILYPLFCLVVAYFTLKFPFFVINHKNIKNHCEMKRKLILKHSVTNRIIFVKNF